MKKKNSNKILRMIDRYQALFSAEMCLDEENIPTEAVANIRLDLEFELLHELMDRFQEEHPCEPARKVKEKYTKKAGRGK
jgi:hypothetical protein